MAHDDLLGDLLLFGIVIGGLIFTLKYLFGKVGDASSSSSGSTEGTVTGTLVYKGTGQTNGNFKDWGRQTANIGGKATPSRRWDSDAQYLNCAVIFKMNIGKAKKADNVDVKFRGGSHKDTNGGWYGIGVLFNGDASFVKEYPHPTTKPYSADDKGTSLGSIESKDIALQCIMYNDGSTPVMEVWGNAEGKTDSWTFIGRKKDIGNMSPGPILTQIGMKGEKKQSIQIRVDNCPDAKMLGATAYELVTPIVKDSGASSSSTSSSTTSSTTSKTPTPTPTPPKPFSPSPANMPTPLAGAAHINVNPNYYSYEKLLEYQYAEARKTTIKPKQIRFSNLVK